MIGGVGGSGSSMPSMVIQHYRRPDPEEFFKKIDADEDGALSGNEVASFEIAMRKRLGKAAEDISSLMDFDRDVDGFISKSEFAAVFEKLRPFSSPPEPPSNGSVGKGRDLAALIDALGGKSNPNETDPLDTNGDGIVDAEERQAAFGNLTNNAMKAYSQTAGQGSQDAGRGIAEMLFNIRA